MIDSRAKRASSLGISNPLALLPEPDGSVDLPDRQHGCYSYIGIATLAAGVVASIELLARHYSIEFLAKFHELRLGLGRDET